jgi:hypothetical protein
MFAFMSVVLSAMQVVVGISRGGRAFEDASYGFSIASLFMAAGTAVIVLNVWLVLFVFHPIRAQMNYRQVMKQRKTIAHVAADLEL